MGRHTGETPNISAFIAQGELEAPKPGSRRARLQAEREALSAKPAGSSFRRAASAPRGMSLLGRGAAAVVSVLIAAPSVAFAAGSVSTTSNDAVPAQRLAAATPVKTITFTFEGQSKTIETSAASLHDALLEAGIQVDGDDVVSQELATPVIDGATVSITRVDRSIVTEDVVDAHVTNEVEDDTLPKGKRVVETEGKDGHATKAYQVRVEDGAETSRTLRFTVQKQERVDEVVRVGTANPATVAASASASDAGVSGEEAVGTASPVPAGTSQEIAAGMLSSYGWGSDQFSCLATLWQRESGWNYQAQNRSSGAYGIPQALPGSKMASAGADWRTNPATQIKWGLGYIQGRYGTPCGALGHSNRVGWY